MKLLLSGLDLKSIKQSVLLDHEARRGPPQGGRIQYNVSSVSITARQ